MQIELMWGPLDGKLIDTEPHRMQPFYSWVVKDVNGVSCTALYELSMEAVFPARYYFKGIKPINGQSDRHNKFRDDLDD